MASNIIIKRVILLVLVGSPFLSHCSAQGSDQGDQNDQSSSPVDAMGSQDPNLINPTNKQGYGRDVPYQLPVPKTTRPPSLQATVAPKLMEGDIGEQTFQAALQLGVLVSMKCQIPMTMTPYSCFKCFAFFSSLRLLWLYW